MHLWVDWKKNTSKYIQIHDFFTFICVLNFQCSVHFAGHLFYFTFYSMAAYYFVINGLKLASINATNRNQYENCLSIASDVRNIPPTGPKIETLPFQEAKPLKMILIYSSEVISYEWEKIYKKGETNTKKRIMMMPV